MCSGGLWKSLKSPVSARGETGRHAGFRFLCLTACGFESHRAHSLSRRSDADKELSPAHVPYIGSVNGGQLFAALLLRYYFSSIIARLAASSDPTGTRFMNPLLRGSPTEQ